MIDSKKILNHMRLNGIGKGDLASALNIDRKTVRTYLQTGNVKQDELIEPMAKALGVDVSWLYPFGENGESIDLEPGIITEGNIASVRQSISEHYFPVKYLTVKAQAGIPLMTHESFNLDWIEDTYPVYLPTVALKEKHLIIEIAGDSMEPEIKEGALVMAEIIPKNDIKYESGAVYAVLYAGNRFVVKRIKTNDINVNGSLKLWSDNEKHGNILIHAEDIISMWKIKEKVKEPVR